MCPCQLTSHFQTQGWERCNKMYEKLKKKMFHLAGAGIEVEGLEDACKMLSALQVADKPTFFYRNFNVFQFIIHIGNWFAMSVNYVSKISPFRIIPPSLRPSPRQACVCPHLKVSWLRWPSLLPEAGKISVRRLSRLWTSLGCKMLKMWKMELILCFRKRHNLETCFNSVSQGLVCFLSQARLEKSLFDVGVVFWFGLFLSLFTWRSWSLPGRLPRW